MVHEVMDCLRPRPGELAVDCTLGGGGHAREIMKRLQPGGRLIGLDVDPVELPRTEAALRAEGFGPATLTAHRVSFAALPAVLAGERPADVILLDLGVSSMQLDTPARGFNYKTPGPLDMRMNPTRGEPAYALFDRLDERALSELLEENADEPHAAVIARLLKDARPRTTHALERLVRLGLTSELGNLARTDVKMSIRRTFQALRVAVNHEFAALDALLRALPRCLAPGGRVAVLTFHSGEDRRVKAAFKAGARDGTYREVARDVIRSTMEETRANRRASAAKLRWAIRSPVASCSSDLL
jgi:16S rRNA (cytosine1402-N4)-methyltransferase